MLIAHLFPQHVIVDQLVPAVGDLRRPSERERVVNVRQNLNSVSITSGDGERKPATYSQTQLVRQMLERVLFQSGRNKMVNETQELAVAHVEQFSQISLPLSGIQVQEMPTSIPEK